MKRGLTMLSSDDSVTHPLNDLDGTAAQTAQSQTQQLPFLLVTTTQLPAQRAIITTPLSAHGAVTTTRLPTVIPATGKRCRVPKATQAHYRGRPMVLVSVLL